MFRQFSLMSWMVMIGFIVSGAMVTRKGQCDDWVHQGYGGRPCGRSGKISDRIQNCQENKVSKSGTEWNLVTRTKLGREVWKDTASGLVWSDILNEKLLHQTSEKICIDEWSMESRGYLSNEVKFWLPTHSDYSTAELHGIREILPRIKGMILWTATRDPNSEDKVYAYSGAFGELFLTFADYYFENPVRCVGR